MEWEIPEIIWQSKGINKKDACMRFYDKTRSLYLETDVSGVGPGDGILHIRDGVKCSWDEAPDNTILYLPAVVYNA